jgi:hypothetical protein
MKKLLGIVVLSLLFSGNAYAKKGWSFTYTNYYDMSVSGAAFHKNATKADNMALSKCQEKSKKKNLKPEGCLKHYSQRSGAWATLTSKDEKFNVWNKYVDQFEITLKPDEIIQGVKYKTKKEKEEKKAADDEKIELAKIIEKAKATCETLGFEKGTDKFSDCTLKLYTQEVDNKVALEVAKQKSSSGSSNSGTMVIYDPVRDRQNKIDKGMEMITGRCTLGSDC